MLLLNLDHVAMAVYDLDAALDRYRALYGVEPLHREIVAEQGVEEAMVPVGGSFVQLLEPLGPDTPVGRFLEKRGEGLSRSREYFSTKWRAMRRMSFPRSLKGGMAISITFRR